MEKMANPVKTASVRTSILANTMVWAVIKIKEANRPTSLLYNNFPRP